jgi:pyruvate,water dikinase
MYYNLTSIHSILRTAPLGEHLTRAFNQFVGAEEVTAPAAGDRRAWAVSEALALTRIAAKTAWQYLFLRRRVHAFEHTADEYAAHTHAGRLATRALAELLDDLRAFLDIRCHRWKDASLADAASMVCYALLQRSLAGKGSSSLHNRLLRALPGVPSTIPPLRLWELSRAIRSDAALLQLFATAEPAVVLETLQHDRRFAGFRSEFEQFLEQWGFRSSAELMLTVPSLQENPIPAIELLKTYSASDGEPPDVAISRQAAERLAETSKLLKGMMRRSPLNAAWVWLLLRWTQRAIAYRERARLKQALLYNRCRVVALAIGERLVRAGILRHQDDIFMLTWQEIVELGSGLAMFPQHIAELISWRRRAHAELAAMHPSDTIRLPEGQYLAAAWEAASPAHAGEDGPETALCGIGASGGRVTARAAVLADVREAGCIRRGEVLVTRQTDPGWAPVFGLISGLVIERGGMLSHGAIIAREFGLPCVVGVKNATTRIANGTIVTVDGDHGICETAGAGQPSEDRGGRG